MPDESIESLLDSAASGDRAALSEIWTRYHPLALRAARQCANPSDQDDAAALGLQKALAKISTLHTRNDAVWRSYLYKCVKSSAATLRQRDTDTLYVEPEYEDPDWTEADARAKFAQALLNELSPTDRETADALLAHDTPDHAAAALGIKVNALYFRRRKMRETIHASLEKICVPEGTPLECATFRRGLAASKRGELPRTLIAHASSCHECWELEHQRRWALDAFAPAGKSLSVIFAIVTGWALAARHRFGQHPFATAAGASVVIATATVLSVSAPHIAPRVQTAPIVAVTTTTTTPPPSTTTTTTPPPTTTTTTTITAITTPPPSPTTTTRPPVVVPALSDTISASYSAAVSLPGHSFEFTARVAAESRTPQGVVSWSIGSTTGTATLSSSGSAQWSWTPTSAGTYTCSVSYGSTNGYPSSSTTINVVVS